MEESSFGYWLRLKRKALDLTREGLADRVGYSAETIRKIETEQRRPSAEMAERLAEIFNIPRNERTAFLRFARGDWRSAPRDSRAESSWQVSVRSPRSNLPATVTSLVGRAQEITDICNYLAKTDIRLITLMGPPGIGKTRLSIEVARAVLPDFSDGVFFVALAPLSDPTLLASTIAQALGYVEIKNLPTNEQLRDGIGEKQMLLVLDNCEHLIEDVASLASSLLSACPRLKIVTTSRESLRIPGEWLYPVPALEVPAFEMPNENSSVDMETAERFTALKLFAERARAVKRDFTLNPENIKTVSAICAHLDGLPLAIELIAARIRLMSPQALLERLNDQFILYADGMRAPSARQKTLNDAIGWSYNLFSAEEQKCFAYLSVFSGGFTLDAAEAISSRAVKEKSVSELVISLLDKSLLQRFSEDETRDEPRYTMLVTIQDFGRDRLRGMGEETEARNWHLVYFLELAEKGNAELHGPNQIEWLHRLDDMRDNFRTALQWAMETGQTEAALGVARNLHWFFFVRGDHSEGRQWLGRVLAMPDAPHYPKAYAEALAQIAFHTWLQMGTKKAKPLAEQALVVAHTHGGKWNTAHALSILSLVLAHEHDYANAQVTSEKSMAFFRELDDQWHYARVMLCLAQVPLLQEDYPRALTLHQQALELFRKVGDRYFQSVALRLIGYLQVMQGDWLPGQAALREALTLAQQLDSKWEIAQGLLWGFAYAAQAAGNPARAVRLFWAARNFFDSISAWQEIDDPDFETRLAACRAALSEAEFTTAVEEGRAMTMERAIVYALQLSTDQ